MPIRTVSNAGGNYNATSSWVEGTVPGNSDDVVFTSTSGPLTINVASQAGTINFTNYVNTITFNNVLVANGDVNLGSGGYTQSGSSSLNFGSSGNLTSNGVTWSRNLIFTGISQVYTLVDDWFTTGLVQFGSGTNTITINSNRLYVSSISMVTSGNVLGTTNIIFNGAGYWSHTGAGYITNNLTFDTTETLSLPSTVRYRAGTMSYINGNILATSSTLYTNASTTLQTDGVTWSGFIGDVNGSLILTLRNNFTVANNFTVYSGTLLSFSGTGSLVTTGADLTMGGNGNGNASFTLPNNLNIRNLTTFSQASTAIYTLNNNSITINGNLTVNMTNLANPLVGTTNLILGGDGTFSCSTNGLVRNNIIINPTGTLIISGTINYNTGTFSYVGGAVSTTNSTLNFTTTSNIDIGTVSWNNITFGGGTITSRSNNITLSGTLSTIGTINGGTINSLGNLRVNGTTTGTTNILINGTSSQTWSSAAFYLSNNLTIDKPSGDLILSGNVYYQSGTFSYITASSVVTTGSTLNTAATTNYPASFGNINWNNLNFAGGTITLNSDVICGGTLSTSATVSGGTISVAGNLAVNGTTTGTSLILLNGTGSQTWNSSAYLSNNLTINKISGTLSLSANAYYQTGTFSYISGSVSTTGNTLNIGSSCYLSTNGINWNNVTLSTGTFILGLLNDFNITGIFRASGLGGSVNLSFSGVGLFNPTGPLYVSDMNVLGLGSIVITFPNDISISSFWYFSGGGTNRYRNLTLNGGRIISVSGNIDLLTGGAGSACLVSGNSTLRAIGSGNITCGDPGGPQYSPTLSPLLEIAASGTYTILNWPYFTNTTITYTSGTVSGAACIFTTCTLNLNSGGKWRPDVTLRGATILTSNATFTNLITDTTAVSFTGTYSINVQGNLTINTLTSGLSSPFFINGTSSQTLSGTNYLSNNLTIDKISGTLSLGSSFYYQTGTFSYLQGDVNSSTNRNTLFIGSSCTLKTQGMTLYNISPNITGSVTLGNDLAWSNLLAVSSGAPTFIGTGSFAPTSTAGLSFSGTSTVTTAAGLSNFTFSTITITSTGTTTVSNTLNCTGTVSVGGGAINGSTISNSGNLFVGGVSSGTTTIVMNGLGSQTWTASNYLGNNLIINKPSGDLLLGPNIYYQGGTFSYVTGSVVTTNNTFNIGTTCNLNTNGITWYNVTNTSIATVNLISDLLWTNNWSVTGGTLTFTGSGSLTASTTGNVAFSGSSIITLKNQIQVVNATLGITTINTSTMSIVGNLTISNTTSGTTNLIISGTGSQSWTHTTVAYLSNNITINKPSGSLILGNNVYYATGTLTHILGDVDVITNSNTFITVNATINTSNITWNNFFFGSGGPHSMTLANDLYVLNNFTCGGNGPINGAFNIYCGNCNINNSSSGASTTTITYSGIIYCSNNLTFSGNTSVCSITGTAYVGGSVFFNAPVSSYQGAANIYMVGNGVISSLSINYPINTNLYFDTGGKITISTPINFAPGSARIINLIRGNVDASKCDLYLNQAYNHTLTNMHKIAFRGVYLGNAASLTMNEFFCGNPNLKTIVASSVRTNYTVTFTDNFEKISKFVNINNCTLSRPGQLLMTTQNIMISPTSSNIGIRYRNNLPNGIPKNLPTAFQPSGALSAGYLMSDPAIQKSV